MLSGCTWHEPLRVLGCLAAVGCPHGSPHAVAVQLRLGPGWVFRCSLVVLSPLMDASSLLLAAHGDLLRLLCCRADRHYEGLPAAARSQWPLLSATRNKVHRLDTARALLRDVLSVLLRDLRWLVRQEVRCLDNSRASTSTLGRVTTRVRGKLSRPSPLLSTASRNTAATVNIASSARSPAASSSWRTISEEVGAAASTRLLRHSGSSMQRRNRALHDFAAVPACGDTQVDEQVKLKSMDELRDDHGKLLKRFNGNEAKFEQLLHDAPTRAPRSRSIGTTSRSGSRRTPHSLGDSDVALHTGSSSAFVVGSPSSCRRASLIRLRVQRHASGRRDRSLRAVTATRTLRPAHRRARRSRSRRRRVRIQKIWRTTHGGQALRSASRNRPLMARCGSGLPKLPCPSTFCVQR